MGCRLLQRHVCPRVCPVAGFPGQSALRSIPVLYPRQELTWRKRKTRRSSPGSYRSCPRTRPARIMTWAANLIEAGILRIIRVRHFATDLMENKGYETLLTFAVFSELRRRHTDDAFEALDKVVGRVESQPVGYFRDGEPGGFQEQPGAGDLGLADIA